MLATVGDPHITHTTGGTAASFISVKCGVDNSTKNSTDDARSTKVFSITCRGGQVSLSSGSSLPPGNLPRQGAASSHSRGPRRGPLAANSPRKDRRAGTIFLGFLCHLLGPHWLQSACRSYDSRGCSYLCVELHEPQKGALWDLRWYKLSSRLSGACTLRSMARPPPSESVVFGLCAAKETAGVVWPPGVAPLTDVQRVRRQGCKPRAPSEASCCRAGRGSCRSEHRA
ncbi:hypothetical protein C8Q78DRAFT_88239 [Trametes maxima]|nr:hypothetical protein C8Q78DRAFT_88239 [Trametes maxima]